MQTGRRDENNIVIKSGRAVIINDLNVSSNIPDIYRELLNDQHWWHKITVQCWENLERDDVLIPIMDCTNPSGLLPVNFCINDTVASFFTRNCPSAIRKLCNDNLIVPNPFNKAKPFKLEIILAYCNTLSFNFDDGKNYRSVLAKRYRRDSKTLNLNAFHKDPGLTECGVLSQEKIFRFVLRFCKSFNTVHTVILSNNHLQNLSPLRTLGGMKSLVTLDLRNNLIEDMASLSPLNIFQIKELYLDGNPLCDSFDALSYIKGIREIFPQLKKLDGVTLGINGFLPFRRNYLCKLEGRGFVDKFLEHYYSLYDGNRLFLVDLYDDTNALFSTTCFVASSQPLSKSGILKYTYRSRNLKSLSDLSDNEKNLFIGSWNIVQYLRALPPTKHDPYSFTVDLLFYSVTLCIINITGVFRENNKHIILENGNIFGFNRTFVLKATKNNEYKIINDQLLISNATTSQQKRAFKIAYTPRNVQIEIKSPTSAVEKMEMEEAFKSITTLNNEWVKRSLVQCNYDLAKALIMFVDLYKADKIPAEAFH